MPLSTPTQTAIESATPTGLRRMALAVADVNWFTTENLFHELKPEESPVLMLRCDDYLNGWRRGGRPWSWNQPTRRLGPSHWRRDLTLPSGWMKRYPRIGMRAIARTIRSWHRAQAASDPLTLVATYPHYAYLAEQVRPERLVYFNVDDYTLYWPGQAQEIRELERRIVRESCLTVCTSARRAAELCEAVPDASGKIRHLPHGAPGHTIEPSPWTRPAPPPADIAHLPRPILGYVGSLEDRIDWDLLADVARRFPEASIVLIGRVGSQDLSARASCLALSNVHAIGWRSQATIASYNRAFDVCLIPYLVEHPFNQACCPTKIMDTMGSGRPMVSTDLPECRLSSHLFDVVEDPERFLNRVGEILRNGSDDGRSERRWNWAREQSCERVAARLLDWISRSTEPDGVTGPLRLESCHLTGPVPNPHLD